MQEIELETESIDVSLRLRSEQLRAESTRLRAAAEKIILASQNAKERSVRVTGRYSPHKDNKDAVASSAFVVGPDEVLAASASKRATILLVDDESLVRGFLYQALTERGHSVMMAHGGNDGLRWFAEYKEKIDLVLADVYMPDLSGLTMVQQIRSERPEIKVLFVSGHPHVLPDWANEKTYGLLTKPFTASMLADRVDHCLLM
jgi:CheY-like chemotaxis protein